MNEQNTSFSTASNFTLQGEERQRALSNGESSSIFQTPSKTNDEAQNIGTPYSAYRTNVREEEQSNGGNDLSSVKAKYTEKSPSAVKSETRTLLKKMDTDDALEAFEQLYTLSLFASHRQQMLDTGVISSLTLALKTKHNRIKEYCARTLQLFAQDGEECCISMKRLNMCNSSLEIISKVDDLNVRIPVVGLIYWLCQNPHCKKEFIDMGTESYIREISNKNKDPMLAKYLNYVLHSLSSRVKSREEMLNEILLQQKEMQNLEQEKKEFISYVNSTPRHFFNMTKTPASPIASPRKKLEFSTPSKGNTSFSQTDKSTTLKSELVYESDEFGGQ